nr:H-NS family nucleoid-associated regulatory protein [Yoonia sp.]
MALFLCVTIDIGKLAFNDIAFNVKVSAMSKLEQLLAQQEALTAQIEEAKKQQKAEDLKKVRELCRAHGFTARMLKGYLAEGRVRRAEAEN